MCKRHDSSTVWVNGHAFHGLEVDMAIPLDAAWVVRISGREADVLPVAFVGDLLSALAGQGHPGVVPVTVEQDGVYRRGLVRAAGMEECYDKRVQLEFIGWGQLRTVRRPYV